MKPLALCTLSAALALAGCTGDDTPCEPCGGGFRITAYAKGHTEFTDGTYSIDVTVQGPDEHHTCDLVANGQLPDPSCSYEHVFVSMLRTRGDEANRPDAFQVTSDFFMSTDAGEFVPANVTVTISRDGTVLGQASYAMSPGQARGPHCGSCPYRYEMTVDP